MRWLRSAKHFLNPYRFLDAFFAYARGGLADFRRVLNEMATFRRSVAKRKPFQPTVIELEPRQMPSATVTAYQLTDDPRNLPSVSLGEANADIDLGALRLSEPLDFDISPGTQIGGNPALVYNSATVDVQPIIEVDVSPDGSLGTLDNIAVQLTWNGGTPQSWVTFTALPSGSQAVAVQMDSPLTATGEYDFDVNYNLTYASGSESGSVTGSASEVVQDSSASGQQDYYGAGWGIAGIDHLVATTAGVIWVYGTGDSEYFPSAGGGAYTSPTGNYGTLTQVSGGYLYTDNGSITEQFDSGGLLTSAVTTDNLTRTYAYDSDDRLTEVVAGDGGTTTLDYDSNGFLTAINEPGGRTIEATQSESGGVANLTALVDAADYERSFTYSDGQFTHDILSDSLEPYDTSFDYNSAGLLDDVNLGLGSNYSITSANGQLPESGTAIPIAQSTEATVTDGLTHAALYYLDSSGHIVTEYAPVGLAGTITAANWSSDTATITVDNSFVRGEIVGVGGITSSGSGDYDGEVTVLTASDATFTYELDTDPGTVTDIYEPHAVAIADSSQTWSYSGGSLASYTDQDGNATSYGYDSYGQLTSVTDPDGDSATYYRDGTFYDNITETVESGGITTFASYDSSGEMTQSIDADGYTTTYTWSGNRMVSEVDPDGDTTTYAYDANKRLIRTVDPDGNTSLIAYDASGNISTTTDPDGYTTSYTYDGDNNLVGQTNPAGDSDSYTFDAAGFETASVVGGVTNSWVYDQRGWLEISSDGDLDSTDDVYDAAGNVTVIEAPDGNETHQVLNVDGFPTAVIDANGYSTQQFFDADGNVTESINPDGDSALYKYDADGRLTSTTDPDGYVTSTGYDSAGRITSTTDGDGNSTYTYYDKDGNVTESVDADGNTTTNFYDAADNLTKMVDGDGDTTLQYFDRDGNVTETVDPDGYSSYQYYDRDGNITESVDADGYTTLNYFDGDDRNTETVDPDGHTTLYSYDSAGDMTKTVDADGNITQTAYDGDGNVVSSTDGVGVTTYTSYNGNGDVVATVDGDGNTTLNYYDLDDLLTKTVDGDGNTTLNFYDPADYLTASVSGDGYTTTYVNDPDGNATKVIDPLGHTTQQFFDGDGNITKTIDAAGYTSTASYDGDGNEVSNADGAGNTTSESYDRDGNVTKSTDGAGDSTYSYFDPDGNLTKSVDGDGKTTLDSYDSDGNLTKTVDADGGTTLDYYDHDGNLTKIVNPDGYTTLDYYDNDGNLTKTIDPDGHTELTDYDSDGRVIEAVDGADNTALTGYDNDGNVTASVDGDGDTTTDQYDHDGNLTLTVADGVTTQIGYDADGNQTAAINGDNATTLYQYNADDQETAIVDPDGNTTTYLVDYDGNQTEIIAPDGGTTWQSFDGDGQVTQEITPDGNTINFSYDGDGRQLTNAEGTFTYDGDGNMLSASNANGTYSFSYNSDDQLTKVTEPFGVTLNFAYDADGNQTLLTDSFGGTEASSYDSAGYLTQIVYTGESQSITIDFSNNKDGQATGMASYDGGSLVATTSEGYDSDGNVTSIYTTNAASTVLQDYSYAYNSLDQLSAQVQDGVSLNFAYDSSGQLTEATTPGVGPSPYTFDLGYDANGNRDTGGTTVGVANEISTDGTWNYTYDADGNLTEKTSVSTDASWTYAYNAANELTQVQEYGSSGALVETVDYKYDAFGEEIEQDVTPYGGSTTTTKFAYNGWNPNMPAGTGNANFQQIAILNSDDSLQTRNIEGNMPGQNLARVDESSAPDGGGVYFLLNDYQNSVQAVVDTSGNVKDAITYNAFGTIESETDATYRGWYAWTGMETDQQTGLQYNNARWYNAATGTWITQDPLGFDAGDSNLYRYVNNAPTQGLDPSGQDDERNPETSAGKRILNEDVEIQGERKVKLTVRTGVGFNQVVLKDGAKVNVPHKNGIAISIGGLSKKDVQKVHFLQTGWITVQVYKGNESSFKSGAFDTTAGKDTPVTSDPDSPAWFLDTSAAHGGNDLNRFYEVQNSSFRSQSALTVYDEPGFPSEFVKEDIVKKGVTKVLVTYHFVTEIDFADTVQPVGVLWNATYTAEATNGFKPGAASYEVFFGAEIARAMLDKKARHYAQTGAAIGAPEVVLDKRRAIIEAWQKKKAS